MAMENTDLRLDRRTRHPLARGMGLSLGALLAAYLFAVHTGPAVAIMAASVTYLIRRRRHPRRKP